MRFPRLDWSELSLQVMMTFGHFLWQACAVAIVLVLCEQLSSIVLRRSSNMHYTVACFAFFALPVCVASTFAWVHQSRGTFLLAASAPIQSPTISMASASETTSPVVSTEIAVLPPLRIPAEADSSTTQSPEVPIRPASASSWVDKIQSLAPYLLIAYTIGVCLMLTRFGISIVGSSRLRLTLQSITDSSLLKIIADQSSRLGLKRVPIVAICQRVSVPVVVGIVKPMILVPPALVCGFDPNQLAAILSHEMAHIRRYDLIVNLLQRIVEALLFFHPVTWWISRRVSIERENCCDDVAAEYTGRLPYADALLQLAELCVGNDRRRIATLATLSADGGNTTDFGYRIRRLIGADETTRVGLTRRSMASGMAVALLLSVSLVAWGRHQKATDENSEDGAMSKIFTPEPLWQTKVAADEVASEMFRISPVVVTANRVLSSNKDFDLKTGQPLPNPFVRLPRTYEFKVTLDPVLRRKSSDRAFLVEVSVRMPGNTWSKPSYDLRVLRASDYSQVGTTITLAGMFKAHSCDVDVENGGSFVLVGDLESVRVYRTETGQIETTMPVKTKRVDAVAFSPDRKWLVVSDQNDFHFWRWRDQAPVKTIQAGRKIDSLVFTPDGQYLAEGPDTREDIQIRDMRTLEVVASLKDEVGSPLMVSSMDVTPDGRYLFAHNEVSVDQTKMAIPHRIHVWDLRTRGKPVFQIATGQWVRNVAFSDDGRMIVGEFSGATHGALLAAWKLPDELIRRRVDAPSDAKDRLGDGIQWSRWGDKEEPTMKNDLKEISELIASGKTIPRELNEKYQAAHLKLTAAQRLKSVKLLAVPDFVMQVLLSEPTYSYAEKVALLTELKNLNFGSMEFGLQEWLANVATEYAKVDPAATREWLTMFQGAEYGVGMGLTAVLEAAKQKDPAKSLEILRSLSDTEGECIVTYGDIPKYELPASDWLKEVQRFQSQRLRSFFLGGPMVFRFGEESPEAALDYILTIPKETRNQQLGYQLVSSLLRSKRFTWTEILDWMETKLPIETRSAEHYGLLASSWSQQDNTSFQTWFQSLSDAVIRDEVIMGFDGEGQPRDWPEIFKLATSVTDQTKRQAKVAWALDAWKLTDPTAAMAQLDNADISKERRTQLHRDITARLAQIANAQPVSEIADPQQIQGQRIEKPAGREQQILGQWEVAPTPAKAGIAPQAESMTLKFSEQGKFESYVQKQDYVEFATGSWKLDGNKVSVRYKPFAMQPTNNSDVEATLQFDTAHTLILDGTRFHKRTAATPVALDAKHPLHGIAKVVLSKLNASAPLPEDANDVMRMLNTRSPHEIWQLVQLSDKPTMSATQVVDRFDPSRATGYRLLFARDYQESANTMQQAVLMPTELPFRVRTEQFELVLFADQPSKAPPELRSRIAWLPAKSRWPTHDICLGDGLGYTWFVRGPIQIAHPLKSELQLAGGDDMIASLVQMTISMQNFPHAADANTASGMLASYGDRAVTAVEQAVRKKKPREDLWHTIRSLAYIRTDSSTRLLIQLYQSEDADIRNAATYALIHVPYRQEASQVYLDLLTNRMRVEQASAACVALGLKDAIPILKELFANASKPLSLRELNTIFTARRTLEGNPIPTELLEASQTIFLSSAVDATDQGSAVGKAIQQFKDSKDEEAVVVLALQWVGYTNKANVNHICAIGAAILREKKQGPASLLLKSILDSLPERERGEVLQKILGK